MINDDYYLGFKIIRIRIYSNKDFCTYMKEIEDAADVRDLITASTKATRKKDTTFWKVFNKNGWSDYNYLDQGLLELLVELLLSSPCLDKQKCDVFWF